MSNHTPGPWKVTGNCITAEVKTRNETLHPTIALIDCTTSRWEHNAQAVASVPALTRLADAAESYLKLEPAGVGAEGALRELGAAMYDYKAIAKAESRD